MINRFRDWLIRRKLKRKRRRLIGQYARAGERFPGLRAAMETRVPR